MTSASIVLKAVHDLKQGDVVRMHGGRFRVLNDAHESSCHRPESPLGVDAVGPSEVAWCDSVCIEGQHWGGYWFVGSHWSQQGNRQCRVIVEVGTADEDVEDDEDFDEMERYGEGLADRSDRCSVL